MIELVVRKSCDRGRPPAELLATRGSTGWAASPAAFTGQPAAPRDRYTVGVVVIRSGKRAQVGKVGVRVGSTRAERTAVPAQACGQAAAAGPALPGLFAAGGPPSVPGAAGPRQGPPPHRSTPGFRPPRLPLPSFADPPDGAVRWVLYGVMGLAALTMVFALTGFARKQWPVRG